MDAEAILKKIQNLYGYSGAAMTDVSLESQACYFGHRARDYVGAAAIVAQHAPQHWLPIVQLTGQAVELSLKACLASARVAPPTGHDLIDLYRRAATLGFQLDAPQFAAIVHLQHLYFRDLVTGTKFKSRYPTKRSEHLGGALPDNSVFTSIVDVLLDQAKQHGMEEGTA